MHIFINHTKVILRNKPVVFWTLLFPIILATLFNFAFSNLNEAEQFESINIGIVDNQEYREEISFNKIIEELSDENENQLFIPNYYKNEKEAAKALEKNKIDGYYLVNDGINLIINNNGINQTIMKTVIDTYYQNISVINNIADFNYDALSKDIINGLNNNKDYFQNKTNKNLDETVIYFYTLIAMVCMYGAMYGMNLTTITEANLSKKGARITTAPTHKFKVLISSLASGLFIQYMFLLILFIYMVCILKIDFGTQIIPLLFLMFIGTIAGVSLGLFTGVISKKNETVKTGILLSIIMLGCFLSGMMMIDMKYIVSENVPILAKINPVSVITDALYSLYYYTNLNRYYENIIYLVLFIVVMIAISYFFLRRKKYDSI